MKFIGTLILLAILTSCGIDDTIENNSGWEKEWGTDSTDAINSMVIGLNDKIYVGGRTLGDLYATGVGIDAIVAAFDSKGNELWGMQWSADDNKNSVKGLISDEKGNIYAGGGGWNSFLVKFSFDGEKIWEKFPETEDIVSLAIDKSEIVYTGTGYGDVLKFSSDGKELGKYNLLSNEDDEALIYSLSVDSEGNIYAGGSTWSDLFGDNSGETDAFLVKIAPDGTHLWEKQWGGSNQDSVQSIVYDEVEDVVYAAGGGNFILKKFSSSGEELWTVEGSGVLSLTMDSEGNLYAGSGADASLIEKYNSKGEKLWSSEVYEDALAYGIACDSNGNVYAAGEQNNNNFLIKITPSEMK